LTDLKQGRHGTQAIVSNNNIYIAAGCGNRGGTPELNTQEAFYFDARTTPSGSALTQSKLAVPTSVNFGTITINSSSSKSITLTNTTGNQAIVISSLNKSGANAFTFSSPYTLPFVLAPGKSVSISIRFSPKALGSQSGSLVVNHSGQVGSATIALKGTGESSASRIVSEENQDRPALTQTLNAYPNPVTNNQFRVDLPEEVVGEVPFVILNASGTALIKDKIQVKSPTSTLHFNLTGQSLNSGIYYLKLNQEGKSYYVKLLLNNE
ncbi:MAG: choice-of-anchor D domain-containing protein, partial [Bacteroidota bacterium]|nr:choice-of-anchor D domain-containing protein [Bacteroidota bacterium]